MASHRLMLRIDMLGGTLALIYFRAIMPNKRLLHPDTCTQSFGEVPSGLKCRHVMLPPGNIHLLHGRHSAPNRGFGACHIWAEHRREMEQVGLFACADVPRYVAGIVGAGSQLYYEGGHIRTVRLMAVRSPRGVAILELRNTRSDSFWSIVTAYSSNKKHGTLVGTVL